MISESQKKMLKFYNNGLSLYKKREWEQAIEEFKKGLELEADDGPTKLYIARCKSFQKNPPPEDWDGVFTITTK